MAEKRIEVVSPHKILIKGEILQRKLVDLINRLESAKVDIMNKLTDKLQEACKAESRPFNLIAALMVSLEEDYALNINALVIQEHIRRVVEINKEVRELTVFTKSIMADAAYELTWQEALRFDI